MNEPIWQYRHFGLTIGSELLLPLEHVDIGAHRADVHVHRGIVATGGHLMWRSRIGPPSAYWDTGEHHVLDLGTARFAIGPDVVVVDAEDGPVTTQLLLFLVWSTVLAMRGRQTLHGAVVGCGDRGIALFGSPGYGKSTGSLLLIERGWRLVTDDLVTFDDDGRVIPGPPYMRLREDRVEGRPGELDGAGKVRFLPAMAAHSVTLAAAVVLADRFPEPRRLSGAEAIEVLLTTSYNVFPTQPAQAQGWLKTAVRIARQVSVHGAPPRSLTADQLSTIAGETS